MLAEGVGSVRRRDELADDVRNGQPVGSGPASGILVLAPPKRSEPFDVGLDGQPHEHVAEILAR